MALIDVKRDDQPIAAEPVEKPDEMTLSAFRELLGARMRSSDEFLSKAGSPIDRVLQEDEVKVSDILEKDVVKIRGKSEPAGPVDVRVMKSGKSTPVKAEIEKSLSEFRKQVSSLIAENERFQEKDVAGSSFTLESEKAYKVKDAMDKNQQIIIVPASPKRTITVQKGTSSQAFPEIEESQSLLLFKKYLVANSAMTASDIFVVSGADVKDEQAGAITVGKAASSDGKIVIKTGPSVLSDQTIALTPTEPKLRDWAQPINYGSPEYPTPAKFAGARPTEGTKPDKWSALKDSEKQYVFSTLQLGSSIVFLTPELLTQHDADPGGRTSSKSPGLTKADKGKAVKINAAEPGVIETNTIGTSSHEMTYSQTVHELRKRGATSASASVGAKGVAVEGGFTTSNSELDESDRSKAYMLQLIHIPAVELSFDENNDVVATDAFKNAIRTALNKTIKDDPFPSRTRYYEILTELEKYGHFIPMRYMLGGAFIIEEEKTVDKVGRSTDQSTSVSGGVGAGTTLGATVKVSAGNTQEAKETVKSLAANQSVRVSAIGGNRQTFASNDPSNWINSLGSSTNWAVTDYKELVPTIRFLPPDLLRQCLGIIKLHWADPQTERRTALNMLEYATVAEAKRIASEPQDAAHELYGGPRL